METAFKLFKDTVDAYTNAETPEEAARYEAILRKIRQAVSRP